MKITFIQVEEAFARAAWGESVRAIAREFGVTEGCLRFHFRKGTHPRELRRLAFQLLHAEQRREALDEEMRQEVDRLVAIKRLRVNCKRV